MQYEQNPRHSELSLQLSLLIDEYSELLYSRDELLCHTSLEVQNKYFHIFGNYKFQLLSLEIELNEIKLRVELIQTAINLGETPDLLKIESLVKEELME